MPKLNKLMQLMFDNKDRKKEVRSEVSEGGDNVILIYDIIDPWWGVSAAAVSEALDGFNGADVSVRINSPGGDVFEGRAIQTLFKQYAGNVTVYIDGLAASAASTIVLGADKRVIADGAFFMVHNSMTMVWGNKEEMRKTSDLLEKIDDAIGKDYVVTTGQSREQVTEWMNAETWFNAEEAKEHGFVDEIFTGDTGNQSSNRAAWNLAAYSNTPKALAERNESEIPKPDREKLGRYLDMVELEI